MLVLSALSTMYLCMFSTLSQRFIHACSQRSLNDVSMHVLNAFSTIYPCMFSTLSQRCIYACSQRFLNDLSMHVLSALSTMYLCMFSTLSQRFIHACSQRFLNDVSMHVINAFQRFIHACSQRSLNDVSMHVLNAFSTIYPCMFSTLSQRCIHACSQRSLKPCIYACYQCYLNRCFYAYLVDIHPLENRIKPRVYIKCITRSTISSVLFAGTGIRKISYEACGFSSIKFLFSDYPKGLISRINEVHVFLKRYFTLKKNIKFIYNRLPVLLQSHVLLCSLLSLSERCIYACSQRSLNDEFMHVLNAL